jgi:type VI secretion system protein ImpA
MMPSPVTMDFEKLLKAIPGDNPAGVELRSDPSPVSDYYTIKDARNKAAAAERKISAGDLDKDEPPPDWRTVVDRGSKAIAEKSKHLEITTYVIEGLLRQHGYAGLRDGFHLARELVEKYWDKLYPLPDEEGPDRMEPRVGHLTGLNDGEGVSSLLVRLNLVPITALTSVGQFDLSHYREATNTSKISDSKAREKKIKDGALSMDTFVKAIEETPPSFYLNLVQDLTQCAEEFDKLSAALKERCEGQEPPSSTIRSALEKTLDTIKDLARNKLPAAGAPGAPGEAPADGAPAGADGAKPGGPAAPGLAVDVIQNREDAFRNLLKVADYFRRTEPHSIVSYSLEQVVHWGRMSLPELLTELIPEEAPRKNIFKQVGIKPPEAPPKDKPK